MVICIQFMFISLVCDLKPIDNDGICEPICSVNILNKKLSKKKSITKTFNPYFDQILVFKIMLTSDQLSSEKIKISIFDTNNMLRNVLIGGTQFDLNYIYSNCQHHEIYKTWTGLFNPNQIKQEIKGYLKLSITILGPNDEKYIHSNSDDNDDEDDVGDVILPPFIEYSYKQLILSIYQTRYLANLHLSKMKNKNKATTYQIRIEFCDKKLTSKDIKVAADDNQEIVDFNLKFLIPVRIPNFHKNITMSILQETKLISKLVIDYNDKSLADFKWYKLYGSHFDFTKYRMIKNKDIANTMNSSSLTSIEQSCFRGQIGINCKIIPIDVEQAQQTEILPMTDEEISSYQNEENQRIIKKYTIKLNIYQATNVIAGKYCVKVQCGSKFSLVFEYK